MQKTGCIDLLVLMFVVVMSYDVLFLFLIGRGGGVFVYASGRGSGAHNPKTPRSYFLF